MKFSDKAVSLEDNGGDSALGLFRGVLCPALRATGFRHLAFLIKPDRGESFKRGLATLGEVHLWGEYAEEGEESSQLYTVGSSNPQSHQR